MKNLTPLLFLFFAIGSTITAQQRFTFGLGSSATSRALIFNDGFSTEEKKEIRNLEVPQPSFYGEIGYLLKSNETVRVRVGGGYIHRRYGSKKFELPEWVHNTTPQYGTRKQVVYHGQQYLFWETLFLKKRFLKSKNWFLKCALIRNDKEYTIYEPTYSGHWTKEIIRIRTSHRFALHTFDVGCSLGLNYGGEKLFKNKLNFQPFFNFNIRPYETDGTKYSYLYFDEKINGFLWDVGLMVQYHFKL